MRRLIGKQITKANAADGKLTGTGITSKPEQCGAEQPQPSPKLG